MALKPVKKRENINQNNNNKEGEKNQIFQHNISNNIFTPSNNNQNENPLQNYEYLKDTAGKNQLEDEFFKEEATNNDKINNFNPLESLLVEIANRKPTIPEGEIKFLIKNLSVERDVESIYGLKNQLIVLFHFHKDVDGEIKEYELKQKFFISKYPKSRFYNLYKDLTGKVPTGAINLRELYGISGTADIIYYQSESGDVFENVANVRDIRRLA